VHGSGRGGRKRGGGPGRPSGPSPTLRRLAQALLALACLAAVALPGARGMAASSAWNAAPRALEGLPVVRQSLPVSCGPAALATLATWLGDPRSEAELLAVAQLTEAGVTLSEFARLADLIGLPGTWYRVAAAELQRLPAPFVAHLEAPGAGPQGHLVVVGAAAHGYLLVGDPAEGAYVTSAASLARRFTGRVFLPAGLP